MSTIRTILQEESQAVAVYDTEKKKCVLIFSSNNKTDKYVFDIMQYRTSRTRYLVMAKGKTSNNFFKRSLAFRPASPEQRILVKDCDVYILDDSYLRKEQSMKANQLSS